MPQPRKRRGPYRVPGTAASAALSTLVRRDAPAKLLSQEAPAVEAGLVGRMAGPAGMGPPPIAQHEPGGDMLSGLLHPSFTVYDDLFQTLPEQGMFSPKLNPRNPFQFTMGSFTVPQSQALWLSDYQFGVLLFDGVNPGDYRLAEAGRFRGSIGFDLTVMDRRQGNIAYQLDPTPVASSRQQFEKVVSGSSGETTTSSFFRNAASSFALVSGQGTALMPAGDHVQGPRGAPWTWIVEEGDVLAAKCVIFRRLRSPIAGIFARLGGHLLHVSASQALVNRLSPR